MILCKKDLSRLPYPKKFHSNVLSLRREAELDGQILKRRNIHRVHNAFIWHSGFRLLEKR